MELFSKQNKVKYYIFKDNIVYMRTTSPGGDKGHAIYLRPIYLLNKMKMRQFCISFVNVYIYSLHGNCCK